MIPSGFEKTLRNGAVAAAAIFSGLLAGGCSSLIYDDTDCVESCNLIQLRYDHNMKFADAFDHEVEQVSLLVFDEESRKLVARMDVDADKLTEQNEIALNIAPGEYELLVWAGRHAESFDIAAGQAGQSAMEDFHCRMRRADGGHVTDDLARLYHGTIHLSADYASPSKPNRSVVYLKKNTNTIRVVLQHLSGEKVDCDDFDFSITDANGWMNHDNSLRQDETLTYHPWYLYSGSVDINTNPDDAPGSNASQAGMPATRSSLGAALAEFTTGRLMWGAKPTLTVSEKSTGRTVLSINVNDYANLVKGFYHQQMSEQEYLDRQDEYNMTFFLDEDNRWINTVIIINDWRIVRHTTPIE